MSASPGRGVLGWRVWVRTVHLYASLLGLALTLFFGVTGFVLNHGEWFGVGQTRVDEREGRVAARLEPLDELALVEELRASFDVRGGLVELHADADEVTLRFARPGEDTDVAVRRPDGAVRLTRERGRLQDVLTDLHKGERGGAAGGLLVDAAALLLLTISLTGLALWLAVPRRRRAGLVALGASLALVAGVAAVLAAG